MPAWTHLARRFLGALSPRGPSTADEAWAASHLTVSEQALWRQMDGPDRRHAAAVARRAVSALGPVRATRPVVAAALLHDVGKVDAGIGTFGRVPATLIGIAGGQRARRGSGRVARYLRHDTIGASLLETAGSDPLTVAWAREHHLPPRCWTIPSDIATALKGADDD